MVKEGKIEKNKAKQEKEILEEGIITGVNGSFTDKRGQITHRIRMYDGKMVESETEKNVETYGELKSGEVKDKLSEKIENTKRKIEELKQETIKCEETLEELENFVNLAENHILEQKEE